MPLDRHHAFGNGSAGHRPTLWQRRYWGWSSLFSTDAALRSEIAEAWRQFDVCSTIADDCLLGPKAWCINGQLSREHIVLAERSICRGLLRVETYGDGRIRVGARAYIGDDCLVSCATSVSVGAHALLAHGVQVFDNDTHPLGWRGRLEDLASIKGRPQAAKPSIASGAVTIGDHAWIGFNSIILKGVTIGERSVVAAGSIVTKDVPADSLVAGNPARFIRTIIPA